MNFNPDKITAFLYKAIDILLIRNPEKTSYGIVLGIVLIGVRELMTNLTTGKVMNAIQSINLLSTFCFGILLVRIDVIFKRQPVDKATMIKLNTIKAIINEGNFSETEKRKLFREFIQRVYEDIEIKASSGKGEQKTGTEQS